MARKRKKKTSRRRIPRGLKWGVGIIVGLWMLMVMHVLILKFVNPPLTNAMAWKWLRAQLSSEEYEKPRYHWRPLKKISPHLIRAVQAGEDQRFVAHHGFDFVELNQAAKDFLWAGRIRGASTITMQTARTLFLWQDRSWIRKSLEAQYTILLEALWSKRRILEIYLNTVDWGDGIMGAEAASKMYFHTNASRLTASQAALLAAILPSPHRWSPANPSTYLRERQKRIMEDMGKMPLP